MLLSNFLLTLTSSTSSSSSTTGSGSSMTTMIIMVVVLVAVVWLFMFRPQNKQNKQRQALMASMAPGDTVLTTSGFYGTIIDITGDTVIVEFGSNKNCRIPMQKAAIVQIEKPNYDNTASKENDK